MIARYSVIFIELDNDYCQSDYKRRLYSKFKDALFAAKSWLNSPKRRKIYIYDRKYIEWGPADAEPIYTDDNMKLYY